MKSQEIIENEIRDYIKKYAIKHNVSEDEAKEHIMCKIISKYYEDGKNV